MFYVGELQCISFELLDVVEDISNAIDGDLLHLVEPLVDEVEDPLVLIGSAYVADDVLAVGAVDSKHLGCLLLVLQLLENLGVYYLLEGRLPTGLLLVDYARQRDADHNQEFLMDVEHQVLEVGVHACLGVDGGLLVRQQVVELNDANRNGFELLRFEHDLLQHGVLDDLVGNDCGEVACLCHIPPVVTVKRGVGVIAKTLNPVTVRSQHAILTSRI